MRWLALIAVLVVGCAQVGLAEPGLGGTSWRLVKFQGGDGTVLAPKSRSNYTLTFGADGVLVARIDCNRGRGGWKSAGKGQLELGAMALTRAQCAPGSLHDQVVKQLPFVRSYVLRDGNLFLSLMADGGTYEFEPVAAPAAGRVDEPLENTYWRLVELGGVKPVLTQGQREPHFILQRPNRRVVGSGGCNRFTGGYELEGGRLKIGHLASTMMACTELVPPEPQFIGALQRAGKARVSGQDLELLDAGGGVIGRFQAVHF